MNWKNSIPTVLALLPVALQVQAQAEHRSDGSSAIVDEIIVTATKRDTALIDSDLSATIIDSNMIDQARLRDFRRIDDLAPNVQFNESGQRGSIFITIRGVESNPFIVNRAAVYIDGIPFRELSNSVLNQIESIEVLRGPQGTLYGANSESGLIVVNTKAPTNDYTANIRLSGIHYSSGKGAEADGFISGSLVADKLAGSLAFSTAREEAYVENLGTSTGETGHIDDTFLQGRLRWTPTDRLTVNATAYWLDMDAPGIFDQQYVPLDLARYNALYADTYNSGRRADDWTVFEDAPKYTKEREVVAGFSANYNLDYGALDFAASYRELDEDASGLDFDLTAGSFVAGEEAEKEEYKNVELRFSSPPSQSFDYIVGLSYYEEFEERTLATLLGQGGLDDYIAAPPQREEGEDASVFGSAGWYPTPSLRLGAGLRYDRSKRKTRQQAGELDLGLGTVITYKDAKLSETFDAWLPRLSIVYKFTEDLSVHASAARGYIPGGFNLTAIQDGVVDDDVLTYDRESLWSREIGFKWRSDDRRRRVSGAIFYITSDNWQEIQIATDDSGRPVSSDYISSDASIRSQGAEFESSWQLTDALTIDGHVGYVDAEYRNLQLDEGFNARGQPIQFVPEYDGGLALRHQWSTGIFARAEVGFTGKTPLRARGDTVQKAVTTLGVQLGYETESFAFRVFGENLTDERRASGLAIENLAFGSDGLFYAPLDAPRIIGFELEAWL